MTKSKIFASAAFILAMSASAASRAEDRAITIKNGETVELARLHSLLNCRNNMKGPATAEILIGPPQLSLSLKDAMVAPRASPNCTQHVPGAILSLTASGVTEASTTKVIVRWRYEKFTGTFNSGRNLIVTMTP